MRLTSAERAARARAGPGSAARGSPLRGKAAGLMSVCLGFFIIQLDVTIVNVALPAIGRQVGGSLDGLQWVIDAYTLALAAFMLTAGSQADRLGARRVFTIGLVATGAGCVTAGFITAGQDGWLAPLAGRAAGGRAAPGGAVRLRGAPPAGPDAAAEAVQQSRPQCRDRRWLPARHRPHPDAARR